jgi:hypothetical protein
MNSDRNSLRLPMTAKLGVKIVTTIFMKTKEILQALPKLSVSDRLKIAEAALLLIRQEQQSITKEEQKHQLAIAAMTAIAS